jgi:cupin 2 domain-containing protein
VVHTGAGATIEHIVSSATVEPIDYDQDRDEWVVVLEGAATLAVDVPDGTETVDLAAGDWVLLPARWRHRVVRTTTGTRWLAVHLPS